MERYLAKKYLHFEANKESKIEEEKNKIFAVIEGGFEDTKSLKALYQLKEHSETHFDHSQEVTLLANRVGVKLGLKDCELNLLTEAALFHDIGKVKIDERILHKRILTDEEFAEMKRHVEYGIEILSEDFLDDIVAVMERHHEFKRDKERRYPCNKKHRHWQEYEIFKKLARIIAVVDVLQSIADNNRTYHEPIESMTELVEVARNELDLIDGSENYEYILEVAIEAMQESGQYFKEESLNLSVTDYNLRYNGEDYFTFLSKNNYLLCNDEDRLSMYQQSNKLYNKYNFSVGELF